jgi:hypothetical protein
MIMTRAPVLSALVGAALAVAACQPSAPARGPETRCVVACGAHAGQCGRAACARGCNLVLDRLVENEGAGVVACVATNGACDDRVWARCAALVGPHADGGPPAPAPPADYDGD